MTAKLRQMNSVVLNLTAHVDEDTLLVVMGDHGMTTDGDHGGDSHLETEAALFVHSKRSFSGNWRRLSQFLSDTLASKETPDGQRVVPQIDFVPTLAFALGLPIPFGNLGKIIPELVLPPRKPESNELAGFLQDLRVLNQRLEINAWQLRRYITAYLGESSTFSPEDLERTNRLYERCEQTRFLVENTAPGSEQEAELQALLFRDYMAYLHTTREICSSVWAQFGLLPMGCGLLLLGMSCLLSGALPGDWSVFSPLMAFVGGCGLGYFIRSSAALGTSYLATSLFFGALFLGGFHLCWSVSLAKKWLPSIRLELGGTASFVVFVLQCLIFTSNSFIVWEGSCLHFLVATLGLVHLVLVKSTEKRVATVGFLVVATLASKGYVCREEQNLCVVKWAAWNFSPSFPSRSTIYNNLAVDCLP